MTRIITYLKSRYWTVVAIATVLPGVASAAFEYMMTGGLSGWTPLVAAALGGGLAALILMYIKTPDSPSESHPLPEPPSEVQPLPEAAAQIFCPRTPAELIDKVKGCTEIQAEYISKPYLGQWMGIEGNITDVSQRSYMNQITVYMFDNEPSFALYFDASTWGTQIGSFDVGDRISAIGKIESIQRGGIISLEECELVS